MRLLFFGTAPIACPTLRALISLPSAEIIAVVTREDKPKGRHLIPQPTAVKLVALEAGIPTLEPKRARDDEFIDRVRSLKPDLGVVFAYGQILPQSLLDVPSHGCINVHTSLLPRHRGAAPIQWAILAGDSQTGVTLMKMDAGLDTGDILTQATTPISDNDTSESLHDRLATLGADLLIQSLPDYLASRITPRKQEEPLATYARKLSRDDARIDWSLPSTELSRRIRAFYPWPGAHAILATASHKTRLKILHAVPVPTPTPLAPPGTVLLSNRDGIDVACAQGSLRLTRVQPDGKRPMTAQEFLSGHPFPPGSRFE